MARRNTLLDKLEKAPETSSPNGADAASDEAAKATPGRSFLPKGAVGALAHGLREIQSSTYREIDTDLIDAGGPQDRLGEDAVVDDDELTENIRSYGQLIPVLLRVHPEKAGRYQIVYGRRRLRACRALGIAVKADVRTLDDQDCVIAQGQENTARKDLTYHERCLFAQAISDAGYDSTTIQAALNVGENRVSEYLKVTRVIPRVVSEAIGPAPAIGRDRWHLLRTHFETGRLTRKRALAVLETAGNVSSDDRFQILLREASRREPRPGSDPQNTPRTVAPGIAVKATRARLTLSVDKQREDFAAWFDRNAETLIEDLHARYLTERSGEEDPETSSNNQEARTG